MLINKIAIKLIIFYQKYISFIIPPSCKFIPSCSDYSKDAFKKYFFIKALLLTLWRILRCNPWSRGGYDPLK